MIAFALEDLLKRDTLIVIAALGALALLCWLAVLTGAGTGMDPFAMTDWAAPLRAFPSGVSGDWDLAYWLVSFFMWATMMVAMMLPSAAPTILLYGRVVRQAETRGQLGNAGLSIASFAAGYLVLWILFSAFAVMAQWALERSGAMSGMMVLRSATLAGAFLIAAGLYQLTPFKNACLAHCRSPAQFIAAHWRAGPWGAWRMGLAHGAYCVGCCSLLMLLLFVGGVMNLIWIAGLTILVALEKLASFGERLRVGVAALLTIAGVALIAAG
jgi:predicted metal-binding membrane protein